MPALKEKSLSLLGSLSGIDMSEANKASSPYTIFTVPIGKVARISHVVIRDATASLVSAGTSSYSFTNFRQTVDLSAITGATLYIVLDGNNAAYTELAAATAFAITVVTGSTAAATVTIDVFGYLT
jgi:hypothetical protein